MGILFSQDQTLIASTGGELQAENFTPQMPLELKANKSVLIFRVYSRIFDHDEREIFEEIEVENEWIGKITEIFKFPNRKILKVTFDKKVTASKANEMGLLAFSLLMPNHDIKRDTFFSINTWYKCYTMEDNTRNNCPKEQNYKTCSDCSEGHAYKESKANYKKCILCYGNLSILAMKCPKRKEIMKNKIKEKRTWNQLQDCTY